MIHIQLTPRKSIKYCILLCLLLFSSSFYAQVVNIETKRMHTDSIRFVSRNDLSAGYNNNNGLYIFNTQVSSTSQIKSKNLKSIFLLMGNYNQITSSSISYQNSWLLHLRYNYKINKWLRIETFIQSQDNEILDVNRRHLAGTGLRIKLINKENFKLIFGNSYFIEYEKNNEFQVENTNHRNNSYISLSASIPKSKIEFVNTFYFQPQYSNFSNYNILNQFKLDLSLGKSISLFGILDYFLDSLTPEDRDQFYLRTRMGIGFKFSK